MKFSECVWLALSELNDGTTRAHVEEAKLHQQFKNPQTKASILRPTNWVPPSMGICKVNKMDILNWVVLLEINPVRSWVL